MVERVIMEKNIAVVVAWHEAVNRADADALIALSDDQIEIGGPRGSALGHAVLRDWLQRAGIALSPRRWFGSDEVLVVEQMARWRAPDGALGDPQIVASDFAVENGRVRRTRRFDSLGAALAEAGLSECDELTDAGM